MKMNQVKFVIDQLTNHLERYSLLSNSHMVDYFTHNLYQQAIPLSIREEIDEIGYELAIKSIFGRFEAENAPKLNEFIESSNKFTLYNLKEVCLSLTDFKKLIEQENRREIKLKSFMTSKKAHEVEILSDIAVGLADKTQTTHLVDIGDGKGYLSSFLAFHYEKRVLGVDASVKNTSGAIKRAEKFKKHCKQLVRMDAKSELYKQITLLITEAVNFDELIRDVYLDEHNGVGLVGLHTCGNLAPSCLRLFTANASIRSICNVGCCYHLLNEQYLTNSLSLEEKQSGFPLSDYLSKRNVKLERAERMLSAQSIDRILKRREMPSKVIFYRSLFEIMLKTHFNADGVNNVGKFRREPNDFVDYARQSFERLCMEGGSLTDQDLLDLYNKYASQRQEMNIFHLLRSFLAPVIESLILLDRYLFLLEKGFEESYLVQLFDPIVSPRCYGVIAYKN